MLTVSRLSKVYGEGDSIIPVLRNISFTLNQGDFVFLTGPSGSGKTTLIKLLILQEAPTKGTIKFEDVEIQNLSRKLVPAYRRTLGVVFQDYKLLEHKTVFENIAFVLEILDKKQKLIRDTVYSLLELVNLKDRANLFPKQLSGGEKRRVVIARAIANNPKLLIADEPTGDLDQENSNSIMELLLRINKAGTSVIMTTHNLELLQTYGFPNWHLINGELYQSEDEAKKKRNAFMDKLATVLPEALVTKINIIGADEPADILELTPSFLKKTLGLSDEEITQLIRQLKMLEITK